jgi:hypothetical protein
MGVRVSAVRHVKLLHLKDLDLIRGSEMVERMLSNKLELDLVDDQTLPGGISTGPVFSTMRGVDASELILAINEWVVGNCQHKVAFYQNQMSGGNQMWLYFEHPDEMLLFKLAFQGDRK